MAHVRTPAELRDALRANPDENAWPSAIVRLDHGGGRLELEPHEFSRPDGAGRDVDFFAPGDKVTVASPACDRTASATIASVDAGSLVLDPPLSANLGDVVMLCELGR